MKKQYIFITLIVLAIITASFYIGSLFSGAKNKSAAAVVGTNVGDLAPNFKIKTIDGREISLASFRGNKGLVITSTASWCPTCITEAREMSPVYPEFKDSVEFLSVSIDPTDDRLKLEALSANTNTPWLYTEPKLSGVRDMIIQYGFSRFEITYVIDKEGIIRFKDRSITSTQTLRSELKKLEV